MIIDTNNRTTHHLDALKKAGVVTIIRYLAVHTNDPDKVVTPDEARAIQAAGMTMGLVYEVDGKPHGSDVGRRDGEYAAVAAKKVGAPPAVMYGTVATRTGAIIWYAVDYDPSHGDMPQIEAAFAAFREAVSPDFRVGCYGSGFCCDTLYEKKLIDARWITQSMGFDGSRDSVHAGRYELLQQLPKRVAGLDTDPDVKYRLETDIGDFVPFAQPAPEVA